jgi:MarC family membrane protein
MREHLQAIATIFSLINPAICVAMFSSIESDVPANRRMADATKVIAIVLAVLLAAAFLGSRILDLFGISLDAFSVAGGGVLAWIGISMLAGGATPTTPDGASAKQSLAPLILFAASPGTITGVITIAATHSRMRLPVTAVVAIVVVLSVTWLLLVLAARAKPAAKESMARDMITRYMGLIVIAMGIQFILTGYKAFMGAT